MSNLIERDITNKVDNLNEIGFRELIINFKKIYNFLKFKIKVIFFAGLIGSIIGLTIAFIVKPNYKAVLTFAMEDDKGSGGGGGLSGALGLASSFGIDLGGTGGGAFAAPNMTELMKSRLIVEKALLKPVLINNKIITLAEYYIEINNLRQKWEKKPSLFNIHFLPNNKRNELTYIQDSLLGIFYKSLIDKNNLTIQQKDKKVSILSIEVNSKNEIFSKLFCENLAQETSNFYVETKSKKSRINVEVLQRQADSVRRELNVAISGVASTADNVYNLNPAFNIKGAPSKKKQIDVQANTAVLTQIVIQLELAKINLRKETPLIQTIDKPILPLEKDKLSKLKSLVFGFIIAAFLQSLLLICKKLYNRVMQD